MPVPGARGEAGGGGGRGARPAPLLTGGSSGRSAGLSPVLPRGDVTDTPGGLTGRARLAEGRSLLHFEAPQSWRRRADGSTGDRSRSLTRRRKTHRAGTPSGPPRSREGLTASGRGGTPPPPPADPPLPAPARISQLSPQPRRAAAGGGAGRRPPLTAPWALRRGGRPAPPAARSPRPRPYLLLALAG